MSTMPVHVLLLPVTFPEGLRPGDGKGAGNRLIVARDGRGRFVLRGSAVAGALRHALARPIRASSSAEMSDWFGCSIGRDASDGSEAESPVRVADTVLDIGKGSLGVRHHNSVDRHVGSVRAGGFFDVEALPPGTRGTIRIEVRQPGDFPCEPFFDALVGVLDGGLVLGGSGARGLGRLQLLARPAIHSFELNELEQHAEHLDFVRDLLLGRSPTRAGRIIPPARPEECVLRVTLSLAVPPGQDVLVGGGQALDVDVEPQRVTHADGTLRWRVPGSSLRGVLRGWISRLAARESDDPDGIEDNVSAHLRRGGASRAGDEVAQGGRSKDEARAIHETLADDTSRLAHLVPCPVMRLFGSVYSRGRLHVSDALSGAAARKESEQLRAHVAIDRVTGGANEGLFFQNTVLTGQALGVLTTTITIDEPTATEARWLASSLRALDRGLVRVGSSKAGGRLALTASPRATGNHCGLLNEIEPCEAFHA